MSLGVYALPNYASLRVAQFFLKQSALFVHIKAHSVLHKPGLNHRWSDI